jgi:hypothetical protein
MPVIPSWIDSTILESHQFARHSFNLRQIVVPDWSHLTVVPRDDDSIPRRSNNRTKIGGRVAPTNPVAYFEASGLVTGHCLNLWRADAAS